MRIMRLLPIFLVLIISSNLNAQKYVYEIELFGMKIGTSTIERIDEGNGEVHFKLNSSSAVSTLFINKSSLMNFDIVYKNGKLYSANCKEVKDDLTFITTVLWDGMKYLIQKGSENFQLDQLIDYSAIQLYFIEPVGKTKIFSERLGIFCDFLKEKDGVYSCKLDNGVDNTYRYKNGVLYELEMSKGASVFMRLVQ